MQPPTYRLEFKEKTGQFHLDNYTHEANTHGWITIVDHCTDLEWHIFESYLHRIKKKKLTKAYVFKSLSELKSFMTNLTAYNISIDKK